MDPQFMLIIGSETIHFVLIIDPYPSVVSQIAKTLKNTHKCILCPALWLMKNLMSSTHTHNYFFQLEDNIVGHGSSHFQWT